MPGSALRQTRGPVFWSVMGHGIVVLLMVVNLPSLRTGTNQPVQLAIEAAVVTDVQAVRERERDAETRRRLEREKAAAARQEQERRQQELDRQKAAQQRQAEAEKQRVEAERIAVKRREEAEQKRRDEARQKAAEEKQRQAAAEKQRQAAEARRREAERQQQQREAQLAAQLAAEQQREDAVRGGLLDQWVEVIRQKVQRNWVNPPSAGTGIECEVRVTQIPGGEVVNVRISSCNADAAVVRSIENAVYKASPLPPPPDASLFERNIIFNFKPVD